MKKIIFLILTILLTSGCHIRYDIKISEDFNVEENINITTNTNVTLSEKDYNILNRHYKINESKSEETITYTLTNTEENITDFLENKELAEKYFLTLEYNEPKNIITVKKSEAFLSLFQNKSLEILKLNITVPYETEVSNAEKITGNTHTWTINSKNYKDDIYIKIGKNKRIIGVNNNSITTLLSWILGALIVIVGIFAFVSYKHKKVNDF